MFEVNDRSLLTARQIIKVFCILGVVLFIVCGIILCATCVQEVPGSSSLRTETAVNGMQLGFGIGCIVVGPFLCWLAWEFDCVLFAACCDLKLIRNKLYGIGNEDLDIFLKDKWDEDAAPASAPSAAGNSDYVGQEAYKPVARAEQALREEKTAAPLSMEERTQKLLRLKKLLDAGTITQEEFDREKAKLLNN